MAPISVGRRPSRRFLSAAFVAGSLPVLFCPEASPPAQEEPGGVLEPFTVETTASSGGNPIGPPFRRYLTVASRF